MIKKSLIAVGACLVLALAWAGVTVLLSGDETEPKKRAPKQERAVWPGQGARAYNTALLRRGDVVSLDSVDFTKLSLAKADATVRLRIDFSKGRPEWLKEKSFYAYQYGTKKRFQPRSSLQVSGQLASLKLSFAKLPTASLGPTCKRATPPTDPVYLVMPNLPGGEVSIAISAPSPPPGACLVDPKAIAANERAKLLAARAASLSAPQVRGKRVVFRGRINASGLSEVALEVGRFGQFRVIKNLNPRPRGFSVPLKSKKGRFTVRVRVTDPQAGVVIPKAAKRTFKVR